MKKRWRKFNFVEWRSDADLRRCSREARSFWLDLVGLIYDAEDGGRLSIKGRAPTDRDLAEILGDDPRTVRRLLSELQAAGVFDIDQNFVVSRRISREEHSAKIAREYGKRGGNPALKNKAVDEKRVNPTLKLETRNQKPEQDSEAKASGADAPADPKKFFFDTVRSAFERAGESREHGASMAAKVWNRYPDQAEAILTAMMAENPADLSRWFGGVFRRLAAGERLEAKGGHPAAPTREIVHDADGNPVAVRDLTTGDVKPLGRAA